MSVDGRPRIVLAMPHYDGRAHLAATDRFTALLTKGSVVPRYHSKSGSSLLPYAFNRLLGPALMLRDRGEITHFAMLHSDVEPQAFWLDVLYAEMRAHNADLVSAVIPIKDYSGKTSTAIGKISDPWIAPYNLTMDDKQRWPGTFGQEICGPDEVLLVNTGCWLADLRRPFWNERAAFNIVSRLDKKVVTMEDKDGNEILVTDYEPQVQPEDWIMSRYLHAQGAKVMATWKVAAIHHGGGQFPNWTDDAPPEIKEAAA